MHKHDTSHNLLQPVNNHNESTMYNCKIFFSPDAAICMPYCLPLADPKTVGGMCYAIIKAHIKVLYLN